VVKKHLEAAQSLLPLRALKALRARLLRAARR